MTCPFTVYTPPRNTASRPAALERLSSEGRRVLSRYNAVVEDIYDLCREMKFEPTWQQRQLLDAATTGERKIAVRSGQGPGKCGREFCEVLTDQGIRKVGDLAKENRPFKVMGMDEKTEKIAWHDAHAFPSGRKQCVKVTLDAGQDIELSTDHPIYTPKGWIHAADLKPGDLVATPRWLPEPPTTSTMSDDEVKFLAMMIAEGGTSQSGTSFTQPDNIVLAEFKATVARLGGEVVKKRTKCPYGYNVKGMNHLIQAHGLRGCLSKHKRLSDEIMLLSNRQAALFLRWFWACDGYVERDGYGCGLASEGLLKDLRNLLLRFGIVSRTRYKLSKIKSLGKIYDSWVLNVSGDDNLQNWRRIIGEVPGKPEIIGRKPGNSNVDIVPIKTQEVAEICKELGVKPTLLRRFNYRGRDYAYWSRKKMEAFVEESGYNGKYARLADNDLFWAKVETVEATGEHDVYDLEVPDTGNFICDGIVVHNTTTSVVLAAWWVLKQPFSVTILTAPTMRQCRKVWLKEFKNVLRRSSPLMKAIFGTVGEGVTVFGYRPEEWGVLLTTATTPESAQGFHGENLNIILEEASGIDDELIEQYRGTISNPNARVLAIGNPNRRDCEFFNFFTSDRDKWHRIHWNAEETPESSWFTKQRNIDFGNKYGFDSSAYKVRVKGEFPDKDADSVLSEESILRAMKRSHSQDERLRCMQFNDQTKAIAYDFARMGGDENVVVRIHGGTVLDMEMLQNVEPSIAVAKGFDLQQRAMWQDRACQHVPDATGMGQGVLGLFYARGKQVDEWHNHATPQRKPKEYDDRLTEGYFRLRELLESDQICLPDDELLKQQLSRRKYDLTRLGKLLVEPKKIFMARGNDSPDRADAIVMAFAPRRPTGGVVVNL